MLGKLAIVLVLCQVVAQTYGGVLRAVPTIEPTDLPTEEECTPMYNNCTDNDDCCDNLRCLDFGFGYECRYGTDNPHVPPPNNNAVKIPLELLKNLGCFLLGQKCEADSECCASFVCSHDYGICKYPKYDPFGIGGFPGKK